MENSNNREREEGLGALVYKTAWQCLDGAVSLYNRAYERYPKLTSLVSTAVGTVGGDAIAKRLVEGEDITLRDIAFTASASVYQTFLYPKLIPLDGKIVDNPRVGKMLEKIRINKKWGKAIALTALFFPFNMFYWGVLSVKNRSPINLKNMAEGAKTIAESSIPYLGVDYAVANKLDKKYALPVWSAAELGWNAFVASKNYLVRRYLCLG